MTDNTTPAATAETLPYKNPDLLAGERIADLLSDNARDFAQIG